MIELFIVLISVPLFLLIVYLIVAVFVLANYSGNKPAKGSPTEVKAPDKTDTTEDADSLTTGSLVKKQYILWMRFRS